jgi:hypothetical protein
LGAVLLVGASAAGIWSLSKHAKAVAVRPLANRERLIRLDDNWRYQLGADVSMLGMSMGHVEGTSTSTIGPATVDKQWMFVRKNQYKFKRDVPVPNLHASHYFFQDQTSHAITSVGEFNSSDRVFRKAIQPAVTEPGEWYAGRLFSYRLACTNGDWEEVTERVTGSEVISVPAGKFTCWKVNAVLRCYQSRMEFLGIGTWWYAPQLGGPVKEDVRVTGPLGLTARTRLDLESTNIDPDLAPLEFPKPDITRASPDDRVK